MFSVVVLGGKTYRGSKGASAMRERISHALDLKALLASHEGNGTLESPLIPLILA